MGHLKAHRADHRRPASERPPSARSSTTIVRSRQRVAASGRTRPRVATGRGSLTADVSSWPGRSAIRSRRRRAATPCDEHRMACRAIRDGRPVARWSAGRAIVRPASRLSASQWVASLVSRLARAQARSRAKTSWPRRRRDGGRSPPRRHRVAWPAAAAATGAGCSSRRGRSDRRDLHGGSIGVLRLTVFDVFSKSSY